MGSINKILAVVSGTMLTGQVLANEKPSLDVGALYVHGALQENTCRMDMDSAWQDVDLGATAHAEVNLAGQAARPVTVTIYLHDCPQLSSWSSNITPLTTTMSMLQPPYKAHFIAVADEDNPDLIKLTGASGIGLRLKDHQGKTVKPSRISDVTLLNPGQDQVTFTLSPERTAAPFKAGPYHALIGFSMIYQ